MLTAMILAVKYLDDKRQKISSYAKIGGVSLKDLCVLELAFLETINYNLYVHPILFYRYREQLLSEGGPLLIKSDESFIQI